jgi:hypothetical protein
MTKKPLPSLAETKITPTPEPIPTAQVAAPPPPQLVSLHVRVPPETFERMRAAAFTLRRDKQDIADEALRTWLSAHNL